MVVELHEAVGIHRALQKSTTNVNNSQTAAQQSKVYCYMVKSIEGSDLFNPSHQVLVHLYSWFLEIS